MLPQPKPEQPAPVAVQVTVLFALPLTVAPNCFCAPGARLTVFGKTATVTRADKDTEAEADLVVSACDVAVTVTSDKIGTVEGAV